jgi:hypothetical protein
MIKVQLIGERIDIEDLQFVLNTIGWKIILEDDTFYLCNDSMDGYTDTNDIISLTKQFLDILNGAIKILYDDHKLVTIGNIIKEENNGKKHYVMLADSITLRNRLRATLTIAGQKSEKPEPTNVEIWLYKSENNPKVRDVLHFFNDITWWNLYKIFEIVRDDIGIEEIKKLIDNERLKTFKQAAQSKDYIGDQARHAAEKYLPPEKNITLMESYYLIKSLFEKWVNSK